MKKTVEKLNAVLTEMAKLSEKLDSLMKQDREEWNDGQWDDFEVAWYNLNDLTDEWKTLKEEINHQIDMIGQW